MEAYEITLPSLRLYVPPIVATQRLGKHVPAATNTNATIEMLDVVFSMLSVPYQPICSKGKVGTNVCVRV
jgi:hypothetical protein